MLLQNYFQNAAFSLLFWQFTNSVTSVVESVRFYPLFGLLGQTGLPLAGTYFWKNYH
jgi:ATP/ADP translocase